MTFAARVGDGSRRGKPASVRGRLGIVRGGLDLRLVFRRHLGRDVMHMLLRLGERFARLAAEPVDAAHRRTEERIHRRPEARRELRRERRRYPEREAGDQRRLEYYRADRDYANRRNVAITVLRVNSSVAASSAWIAPPFA